MDLIIIGIGKHSDVVYDIAKLLGYNIINKVSYKINTSNNSLEKLDNKSKYKFIIGIGDVFLRKEINDKYKLNYITLIHPSSYISNNVKIGKGTLVCAGAIIQTHSNIGDHCIINTKSSVDHHCLLGNFINISPGCTLCSSIKIDNLVFIGASTTIIPEINIGENSIIGAGSLVLKNIKKNRKCYGSPCKEISDLFII